MLITFLQEVVRLSNRLSAESKVFWSTPEMKPKPKDSPFVNHVGVVKILFEDASHKTMTNIFNTPTKQYQKETLTIN